MVRHSGTGENRREVMGKFFCALVAGTLLFSLQAFAQEVKVVDSQGEYVTRTVTARNVKGVEVRLSKEVFRNDCNTNAITLTSALVSGDGQGWYDRYFFHAGHVQTMMHCPLDKPVRETVYSKPVFIKSFTNENVNQEVIVFIVIPSGYKLEAKAVK
jgi:hypothetical protein